MTAMSKEQTAKTLALLKQAKKLPVAVVSEANSWLVRPGTVAVCRALIGGNVQEGAALHALLEPWVETKKKLSRKVDGVMLPCLWFSGEDLAVLTGQDLKSLQNRVIPALKSKPFIKLWSGRLKPDGINGYHVYIDTKELWETLAFVHGAGFMGGLVKKMKAGYFSEGVTQAQLKQVDKTKLPYLFKRLYDVYEKENGPYVEPVI